MTSNEDRINQLHEKLNVLLEKQEAFSREISLLNREINLLRASSGKETGAPQEKSEESVAFTKKQQPIINEPRTFPKSGTSPKIKADIEKFIGENLINKIGIVILIIGVGIGANYAIDNQLISPLTRIIFGYLVGAGLLFFAFRLKAKYTNFSAVLLSGSMAIMYFITFTAYSFYGLIPKEITFLLMVIFTIFTVLGAIHYNRQVIAHVGLVGAYAVPFLLSDGSGRVAILFSYMAIINIGILFIAFKKYWKALYYSSFAVTWLIYLFWWGTMYQKAEHFGLTITFVTIFFLIFYLTFLAYKLLQKEKYNVDDIFLLLANSFIFYGIGYGLLSDHETGKGLLGLFTLGNALVHLLVAALIYWQQKSDRNLFYLISGLVLIFITIAIPVQLNGNWVTLLWAGEAALMFWIGRTKGVYIYEKFSYALMALAFISILQDWSEMYGSYYPERPETWITPLFNIHFLTSILFIAAFAFINVINRNSHYPSPLKEGRGLEPIVAFSIPAILLITLYLAFRMEIANYWEQLYADAVFSDDGLSTTGQDLRGMKSIWIINYSLVFFAILILINARKIKDQLLGYVAMGFSSFVIIVFLTEGLYNLSELGSNFLYLRYISIALVALLLASGYNYVRQESIKSDFKIAFDFLLHTTILWVASSELIHWMEIADSTQSYKLGLSILWGMYSLLLIGLGIWKKKKHLRIGAIILFAVTLVKLFFYDISHLDTIAKTIVFVSLGILLLIISFLYNKYKVSISGEV